MWCMTSTNELRAGMHYILYQVAGDDKLYKHIIWVMFVWWSATVTVTLTDWTSKWTDRERVKEMSIDCIKWLNTQPYIYQFDKFYRNLINLKKLN